MAADRAREDAAEERIAEWQRDRRMIDDPRDRFFRNRGVKTRALALDVLGLTRVPESIRELRDLEVLDLWDNSITELPAWLGELKQLKGLLLNGNFLGSLPPEIGTLQNLRGLWVGRNKLTALPEELRNLELTDLDLMANPALEIPESVLGRPPEEILRYYFEAREDSRPLLELKLLIIGPGSAGKTTLLKRLAGGEPNAHEPETHSIDIRPIELRCPRGVVRARAWDFGGQEILHATHQFFLSERSLYLLVLEPRSGLAQRQAEYWLKLVETQGAASPVIVVLNWSRNRPWRVDDVKLRRKFPFIVDFISTDALHGEGIDALLELITETVEERMTDVWLPFPKRWRQIKDSVATMSENFLTYHRYADLCARLGEPRPDAQADLAGILHALGLALYYGRDPRLHDTRVLNPGWVTGGVYAVIRAPSVAANAGQLAVSDMPRILLEAEQQKAILASDYPEETHAFILELMRAFQLCYASEEENGKASRYLVPELLPEFEPDLYQAWDQAPIRLRYRYGVPPPGLLSRFIVRTHALSEGAPHWRHGVVLRHAGAEALIREELDRPELHVFIVEGTEETRRVLVAIVRRELEILHTEMKMQPIEELELPGDSDQWISVKALREVEASDQPVQKLAVQPEGTASVSVIRELDKLTPAEARAIDRDPATAPRPIRLFVSYAHADERHLKRLDAMVDVLEHQHGLAAWRDRRLLAGEEWERSIHDRLEEMDIFLIIASALSLASPYVRKERQRARERYEAGEVEIAIVKLEPCACDEDEFLGRFQRLAPNHESIVEAAQESRAWEDVRKDLLAVIRRVREKKQIGATGSPDTGPAAPRA